MTHPFPKDRAPLLAGLAIALLVAAVYAPVASYPLVPLDDEEYVGRNGPVLGGLAAGGARWAFTTFHMANWHPLAWLSHMADVSLFGFDPGAFHLVNAAFHLANALLLLLALRAMTGSTWRSAFAAALFAVHPLHVESVAWVAERKDVLSTFFLFLALRGYAWYAEAPSPGRYAAVALPFAASLASKPMGVTFPFLLLVLDGWPLGRVGHPGGGSCGGVGESGRGLSPSSRSGIHTAPPSHVPPGRPPAPPCPPVSWGPLVLEKAPLLLLSAASCAVTYAAQSHGGAVAAGEQVPLAARLWNALLAYGAYLGKGAWPASLAVFYPHPALSGSPPPWGAVAGGALLLLLLTALALRERRRRPWLLAGWLWFLGTLVPVLGLVQVGGAAMADRYAYVPLAGIFLAAAWGAFEAAGSRRERWVRPAAIAAAAAVLLALSWAARVQVGYWRNGTALFERSLAVTGPNAVALGALGKARLERGDAAGAVEASLAALRRNPGYDLPYRTLGEAFDRLGRPGEAVAAFREAARLRPASAGARYNLGVALDRAGSPAEAEGELRAALRLDPWRADGWNNLGGVLYRQGRREEAEGAFREALRVNGRHAEARFNLGVLLAEAGRRDEAAASFREVLRLLPGNGEARRRLAALGG